MKNTISFYITISALLLFASANVFAQDQPPVVTASGNQVYCPGSSMNIVESFNIVDPDDTGTNAIYIQISSGYVNGQDQLSLSTPIPNVTTSWNAAAGKLIISGVGGQELTYATLINAVNNIVYTSSAANPTGTRTFSITVGEANYLPSTGHYYKFVPQFNISWTTSKWDAQNSNYYGLQGYLATLISAEESQLCGEQSSGNGWIGGSDSQAEGVWRWMTGPEAGIIFWNGQANGSSPTYAFWNTGEPNDSGGNEDYAHITAPGLGIAGSWNDLPNEGGLSGPYAAQGYIVEYGGMPGDPILQISGSTTITNPTVTATTPAARCGAGTVALSATVSAGTVHWYAAATGGPALGTGNNFTTPAITATTTYYVSARDENCTTGNRTAIVATVNPIPVVTGTTPVTTCAQSTATLQATADIAATISWYTTATGGTALATGTSFTTPVITANTTYYAEATTAAGCTSARQAIVVNATPLPTVTATNNPQSVCGSGTAPLQATPNAGTINWYTANTGGTLVGTGNNITSPNLTATTTFYAEAINGSCVSPTRQAVTVTVHALPTAGSVTAGAICGQGTATISIVPSPAGTTVNWYAAATGGTILFTGQDFTTPTLSATTTYYAELVTPEGCVSAQRVAGQATVTPLPTVTGVTTPVNYCENSPAVLQATASAGTIIWYDAPTGGNQLTVQSGNFLNTAGLATVYAAAVNNGCESATRTAVQLTENALPVSGGDETLEFCEGTTLTLDAEVIGVTYLWNTNETTQTIDVTEPGVYEVQVTNASGCTDTRIFTVNMLNAPQIDDVIFTNTTITILMINTDLENFEYSIDGVHYQASPTFSNLAAGQYTGYVRSLIGCGTDEQDVVIYLIPKVISPNGDNVNDVFTIAGMSALPQANVFIMDRYGKLITQLNRTNPRWDGTLNGHPVPATDYWYVITIDNQTPEIRGHFALVR